MGGPSNIEMKTGRKDSKESYVGVVKDLIPNHNDSISSVLSRFQDIGVDLEATVALLGTKTYSSWLIEFISVTTQLKLKLTKVIHKHN